MSFGILIADDEELERRALRHILASVGGETPDITEAANGREAIEAARAARPDLALLDIRMPGVDGIEAAREIRKVSPETRCVFVTAFDSFDYAREALRLGVDEYLLKPAEPEAVRAVALRAAERLRAERLEAERTERLGREGEKALELLAGELRDALDRGTVDGERLSAFLELRRLPAEGRCAVVLRPLPSERDHGETGRAACRKLEAIAETSLRDAGWFAIAGSDETEVRVAAAASSGHGLRELLDGIVERSLALAGLRVRAGAAPGLPASGPQPFSAARSALALASAAHPAVVLDAFPAEPEDAAERRVPHGDRIVERAVEYLRSRLAEDVSLDEAAAAVSCSPFHLSRLFPLHAGDTFVRVFTRMRVEAAKSLLRSGSYSVKEVCAMAGFRDQTYFARVFRKFVGTTPAEFRANPQD